MNTKGRLISGKNRFTDKRSKLNDEAIELALSLRYPLIGKSASWKLITEEIEKNFGTVISEQGVSQIFNRYQDIFIITKLSEDLLAKRQSKIKDIYINIDGMPDFKFEGCLIAKIKDGDSNLKVYCTNSANMVLVKDTPNTTSAIHALLVSDITNFFGWSSAAKNIYASIGIDRYIYIN